jgi:hypothetical protein
MCLSYRRNRNYRCDKFSAGLAGVVGLSIIILATPRSSVLYAQENDASATASSIPDDRTTAAVDPTADVADDADDSSVLDLPQVVVSNPDPATTESADPSAAPSAEDQPDELASYAAQEPETRQAPESPGPLMAPGGALAPAPTVMSYMVVRGNRPTSPLLSNGVPRRLMPGPIMPTSPMLMAPRGSQVIMGGWWHRIR